MVWSNEKVVFLIQLYANESILWNPKLPEYRDRNKIYYAWNRIASKLNTERTEMERKLKILLA
ncbi:hypothetical protein WH47_06153 [Habropoda laboriosa]|uniref:MADF domain-containing protein n=1 Tax=Habropoda laboriosa TaxID=597456 RepID=A0A0L7QT63_9HYME|nr:hypothetical protein WH47_06153 [Habropoda laboriosa]